jgi:hypothetical protein
MSKKVQELDFTSLEIRELQERRYTILMAQEVADHKRQISPREAAQLDRYARWHFNSTFDLMVRECREMNDAL